MIVNVTTKTGFYSLTPPYIYKGGKLFYTYPEPTTFNLPEGVYTSPNELIKLKEPVKQNIKYLRPDFKKTLPKTFIIIKCDNENKCSVILKHGIILIDKNFIRGKSETELVYVLFHELGHAFFKTEADCDIFASNEMLKMGYNKSQIVYSSFCTLGNNDKAVKRKNKILNFIQ